jgi:hypothetical protein
VLLLRVVQQIQNGVGKFFDGTGNDHGRRRGALGAWR